VDGDKRPDPARDLLRIAVIERHGKNGNIATGFVRGFGMKAGAIASTVSHDHHNIACVGDYADMALAAPVFRRSRAVSSWPATGSGRTGLPVAGLMSLGVSRRFMRLADLRARLPSLGVVLHEPFLQLAFLALPVIPALKITDRGMVDVTKFEIIPG
jgi:adenine deaminase